MTELAITNDWLPVDQWIAEALDNFASVSQIENDLVDCLLFWSTKHSMKGTSSRDSLEKSLEAVRILVSLGIEYHLTDSRGDSVTPPRLRDFFKAPFTRLKTLESNKKIDTILGLDAFSKHLNDLSAYWKTESKQRIDNRLYALVRKEYESNINESVLLKELLSILNRLIKITKIQRQTFNMSDFNGVFNEIPIEIMIRTILAIQLNKIKRPTKLRKAPADTEPSPSKDFEPITPSELKKIRDNAFLSGRRKQAIDEKFAELVKQLDISAGAMQSICEHDTGLWTDYILKLWDKSLKNAEEPMKKKEEKHRPDPLKHFESHFVVVSTFLDAEFTKSHKDMDMLDDLKHIFNEHGVEYSKKDLDLARGAMSKKDLDIMLRKAEKKGLVSAKNESGKKLYIFLPPESS